MKKLLLLFAAALLSLSANAANVITMTTSNAVGSSLKLNIEATGAVTIDGATGTYESGAKVTYTTTAQTVTITGDVNSLDCTYNNLTALDVSKNTVLTNLNCYDNQLTALDVSKNTALTYLSCLSNQLTALDVSQNTALTVLECDNNQLTSVDVSHNTALTYLGCSLNQLTALDVTKNTALTKLYCGDNELSVLDVTKNTALTKLYCFGNKLSALDVTKLTVLISLNCNDNQLTALDVSKNTALTRLDCYCCQLKGGAMDALIASLPDRTGAEEAGKFVVVSLWDTEANKNICTTTQVAAAKARNWGSYENDYGSLTDYAGSAPTAISSVQTDSDAEPAAIYDLSGRRIEQMHHGVNIVKMSNGQTKKVMVK